MRESMKGLNSIKSSVPWRTVMKWHSFVGRLHSSSKKNEQSENPLMMDEPVEMWKLQFDIFQRYKVVADIINTFRKNNEIFKILEVGAGFSETFKTFLSGDDIFFLDKEFPPHQEQKSNYILGDITKRNIDGLYDFVVAVDTYEHIHPRFREDFIKKLIHASTIATVIAAPFDTFNVKDCEIIANEVYKLSHGTEHRWLQEHIQNGLPSLSHTLDLIKGLGLNYTVIPNGHLPRWFEMTCMYLSTEGIIDFSKIMEELWEFYNKNFYCYANLNPAYRQVIVINKTSQNPDFSDILTKDLNCEDLKIKYEILRLILRKIEEMYNIYECTHEAAQQFKIGRKRKADKNLNTKRRNIFSALQSKYDR